MKANMADYLNTMKSKGMLKGKKGGKKKPK